jgi:hypothetical protein
VHRESAARIEHLQLERGGENRIACLDLADAVAKEIIEADQALVGFAAGAAVVAVADATSTGCRVQPTGLRGGP